MELTNEFTVPVALDRAWEVLNDVELIAPCLPGAQLQEIEGDEARGTVKVKVGPITAEYKGTAVFEERDRDNGRIVINASGRDTRGQGSATAVITVAMVETAGQTTVKVDTDLTIKGKVAQFGRGMIADVSSKLLGEFVTCLEGKLESPAASAEATDNGTAPAEGAEAAAAAPSDGIRRIDSTPSEPVDLLETAGAPLVKRLAPVAVGLLVLWFIGRGRSRRRRR